MSETQPTARSAAQSGTPQPVDAETPSGETIRRRILADPSRARFFAWGTRDYGEVLEMQESLRERRQGDAIPDTWLAGEHPTVITQGVRGGEGDLVGVAPFPVFRIDRGGMTTLHNPGQLALYAIVKTREELTAQGRLSRALLTTVRDWLTEIAGVRLEVYRGRPGLFCDGRKAAAIGISVRRRISMHGIAINLCNDLSPWRAIVPCGESTTRPITLSELAGRRIEPGELIGGMQEWLRSAWGYGEVTESGSV
jgi:lipoate-protein ligase B